MRKFETGLLLLAIGMLGMLPSHVPACGPFFMRAVFTFQTFPALEAGQMVDGQLGVVWPGYWRRYLFVAYRHLSGVPLTDVEREEFLEPNRAGAAPTKPSWAEARAKVPGAGEIPYRLDPFRLVPDSRWQRFENCPEDAMGTAAVTLEDRIGRFGADHPGVLRWVKAQDVVFANCGEGEAIPPEAEDDLPEILKKDRTYQIAAAHFYAVRLREAQTLFEEIAHDDTSPWRGIAPYLAARCLIRRATLDPRPGLVDLDLLSRAAHELRGVLEDEGRKEYHEAAGRMLDYVDARLRPGQRLAEVAGALSRPAANGAEFRANLTDFQALMDKGAGEKPGAAESELVDWVVTFQAGTPESLEHALERWRDTGSEAWLVAALAMTGRDHTATEALIEAASRLDEGSAAWATASYHRVRLLIETVRRDEAREALDAILPLAKAGPRSAMNLFREQRMGLARNLDEFLEYAERDTVGIGSDGFGGWIEGLPEGAATRLLDHDAASVLNRGMPLRTLARVAGSEKLSPPVRREVQLIALARALLLEEAGQAMELARQAGVALELPADEAGRRFAGAYVMLRNPGLRPYLTSGATMRSDLGKIDNLRDNWWCRFDVDERLDTSPYRKHGLSMRPGDATRPRLEPDMPQFLSEEERSVFAEEWKRLLALEAGPSHLGRIVLDYCRRHPDDARAAEALHLVVRATRYGCTDQENGSYSRQAFELLHRQYPDSDWARKTKYWYE